MVSHESLVIESSSAKALQRRITDGDKEAFGELVRRHSAVLLRWATKLWSVDDAEDVVQAALASAWKKCTKFDPDRDFCAWVCGIIRKTRPQRLKRNVATGFDERLNDIASKSPAQECNAMQEEWATAIRECLDALEERERRVVVAYYYKGKKLRDCEERSPATAMRVRDRGLDKLRICLEAKGWAGPDG